MIKTHDRQGILDYFKELGMEIRSTQCNGWYLDLICYPIADYTGTIHLYEIANLENEKLYKLIRNVKCFDDQDVIGLLRKTKQMQSKFLMEK